MRICLVHPYPWPEVRRGGERYLDELSRYLARRGHRVTMVTGTRGSGENRRNPEGVLVSLRRHRRAGPLYRWGIGEVETFGLAAFKPLLGRRFDLVHAFTPSAALAALAAGQRVLYTVLGHPDLSQIPVRAAPRRIFQLAVKRSHAVAVLSEASADALSKSMGRESMVLAPGVSTELFTLDPHPRRPPETILFSASLADPRKRADLALAAFRIFRSTHCGARLVLSGSGVSDGLLEDRLDGVEWAGPGEPGALVQRYRAATVTLLPSEHEAFGLSLVESMACGTPVVCTPSGGMPELVDPRVGRVAADFSPEAVARALAEASVLAGQPGTAAHCARHALRWDWQTRVGPAHETAYRELVPR